jgi:16S rRNA G966 N2-methylase RsmD
VLPRRPNIRADQQVSPAKDFPHSHPIAPAHFELREDGSIQIHPQMAQNSADEKKKSASIGEICGPELVFSSDTPFVRLYHGNCLELLDAIYAKYGDAGRFDAIFADPPYFLSNGGITCHAGKMVKLGAKKE